MKMIQSSAWNKDNIRFKYYKATEKWSLLQKEEIHSNNHQHASSLYEKFIIMHYIYI